MNRRGNALNQGLGQPQPALGRPKRDAYNVPVRLDFQGSIRQAGRKVPRTALAVLAAVILGEARPRARRIRR